MPSDPISPTDDDRTDSEKATCSCDPALIAWEHESGYATEHQYIIPGTCSGCGERRFYVYNEAGIRTEDGTYLHEF